MEDMHLLGDVLGGGEEESALSFRLVVCRL
jgi:hypothetical protein